MLADFGSLATDQVSTPDEFSEVPTVELSRGESDTAEQDATKDSGVALTLPDIPPAAVATAAEQAATVVAIPMLGPDNHLLTGVTTTSALGIITLTSAPDGQASSSGAPQPRTASQSQSVVTQQTPATAPTSAAPASTQGGTYVAAAPPATQVVPATSTTDTGPQAAAAVVNPYLTVGGGPGVGANNVRGTKTLMQVIPIGTIINASAATPNGSDPITTYTWTLSSNFGAYTTANPASAPPAIQGVPATPDLTTPSVQFTVDEPNKAFTNKIAVLYKSGNTGESTVNFTSAAAPTFSFTATLGTTQIAQNKQVFWPQDANFDGFVPKATVTEPASYGGAVDQFRLDRPGTDRLGMGRDRYDHEYALLRIGQPSVHAKPNRLRRTHRGTSIPRLDATIFGHRRGRLATNLSNRTWVPTGHLAEFIHGIVTVTPSGAARCPTRRIEPDLLASRRLGGEIPRRSAHAATRGPHCWHPRHRAV